MSLRRIMLLLPVFVVLFALLNIPLSEASQTSVYHKDIQGIQDQIIKMKADLNVAIVNHHHASSEFQSVDLKIDVNEAKLTQTQHELNGIKKDLDTTIASSGSLGSPSLLSVLAFSRDFGDLTSRVTTTLFAVDHYIETAIRLHSSQDKLVQENLALAALRREKEAKLKVAEFKHIEIDRALKLENTSLALLVQQEASVEQVERHGSSGKIAMAGVDSSWSQSYVSRGAPRSGFMFPVAGAHSYTDSWGAARSGGRRHKGTDIMASRGTPVVACVAGVISRTSPQSRGLGGIMIWLKGDDGNEYFFAHLNNVASGITAGTRVNKGQTIGYVGSTGNASESAPHLHFEVHRGGGSATDPYPLLTSTGN